MMQRTVIDELKDRGFIFQMTETGVEEAAKNEKLIVYVGFDPTGASLHVGHVIPIMGLAHLQRSGHQPIALIGGGTALIGDPSGKQSERALQPKETIEANAQSIKEQMKHFLRFEGENPALMLNNADWLCQLNLIDFLRDVGKHFSLGSMLARDSVKSRLDREQGISVTEFLYALLQSYDFMYLSEHHGCNMQMGGSDQWGNITAGIEYVRRTSGKSMHGITFPLLTKADGGKFGKTESGAIWLDPNLTSPYEMYQFWLNTDDRDVIKFLKFFTFLPLERIAELEKEVQDNPEQRNAQKTLAWEFTALIHGETATKAARGASELLFGTTPDDLSQETLAYVEQIIPNSQISRVQIAAGVAMPDVLVHTQLSTSKGEARRLISQGGVYVNNQRRNLDEDITSADLLLNTAVLLRAGKKKYHLLIAK